jgi:hypothetical protein
MDIDKADTRRMPSPLPKFASPFQHLSFAGETKKDGAHRSFHRDRWKEAIMGPYDPGLSPTITIVS